jgi:hypothetical protein
MSETFKFTQKAIEWRRNLVLEYLARGKTPKQIAEELHLHPSTIYLDMQFLKCMAHETVEHQISDIIPFHYLKCIEGFRYVLSSADKIVQNNPDDKTKIQALALMANTYERIMNLDMNGPTISAAVSKVKDIKSKQPQLQEEEQLQEQEQEQEQVDGDTAAVKKATGDVENQQVDGEQVNGEQVEEQLEEQLEEEVKEQVREEPVEEEEDDKDSE